MTRSEVLDGYFKLDRANQILCLEKIRADNPHLWDYSSMPDSLRKFYSSEPRPEHHGEYDHVQSKKSEG